MVSQLKTELTEDNAYFAASPVTPSAQATTSNNFDDAALAGFRKDYRNCVASTVGKTLKAGALATETVLRMAGYIQDMKALLNRKEFGAFIKDLLQWIGEEARKYLDIAKAFEGFDLSQLGGLEPYTLLKLRTKRYAPVVEKLREEPAITPKVVQDLIGELLPKKSRKKSDGAISGWKQARSGGGRYYNVLLHDEETGILIEKQAENEGILPQRVIAEAIALRAQLRHGQMQTDAEVEPVEEPEDRRQEDNLHREEVVATAIAVVDTKDDSRQQAQAHTEEVAAIEIAVVDTKDDSRQQAQAHTEEEAPIENVAVGTKDDDTALVPVEISSGAIVARLENEDEIEAAVATVYEEDIQESQLVPAPQGERKVEETESDQLLEPETQAIRVGDSVKIMSDRKGAELVGQIRTVAVVGPVGCVVEVEGKSVWFGFDELVLANAVWGSSSDRCVEAKAPASAAQQAD